MNKRTTFYYKRSFIPVYLLILLVTLSSQFKCTLHCNKIYNSRIFIAY